ncbi:hypothetical protein ZWY2020_040621 [Hordeum vulgare]|nr:hypothetical protein ZWY2020_040621 [Hordeum vulgare]
MEGADPTSASLEWSPVSAATPGTAPACSPWWIRGPGKGTRSSFRRREPSTPQTSRRWSRLLVEGLMPTILDASMTWWTGQQKRVSVRWQPRELFSRLL